MTTSWADDIDTVADMVDHYQDRPVQFYRDLGFTLADTQRQILQAIQDHERILVLSGNGTGKTAGVSMGAYHFLMTNYNSLVLLTSGNYDILRDTSWPFVQTIHRRAKQVWNLGGTAKQSAPRIEFDAYPEWWLKYRSPRDPDNLQGRHSRRSLVVIEEADKPDVGEGHFDSATSTASSGDDVAIAIANPPTEKSNVVYQKMVSDRWHVIQFSSFDSHNVKRDLGELPDDDPRDRIPGLVDLDLVIEDYETWNGRQWPGADTARRAIQKDVDGDFWVAREDTDLDPRWFRKRLGVMPPTGQGVLRPWYERHVDAAVDRWLAHTDQGRRPGQVQAGPVDQLGADIARGGGDRTTVIANRDSGLLDVLVEQEPGDHERNFDLLMDADAQVDRGSGPFVIDAVGEGSGVADRIRARAPNVKRFDAGEEADDSDEYYNRQAESYALLGQALKDWALVPQNSRLERELREAARVLTFDERTLRGGTTFQAKGKDALKDDAHLGRSPDLVDGAALATYDVYQSAFQTPDISGVVG